MPETAVDEDNLAKTLEDKVRSARQIAPMEPVSVSLSMHDLSDSHLRPGVDLPDACHPFR
jgi:hypothetical protein